MQELASSQQALGELRITLIANYDSETAANWLNETNVDFPFYLDRTSAVYRAMGLPVSSLKSWHVYTLWWYAKKAYQGHQIQWPRGDEEVSQLGGDMIVNSLGKIVYLYRCERPDDRPSIGQLVDGLSERYKTSKL